MQCCHINNVNITKTNKHLISYINGDDGGDDNSDGSNDDHELDDDGDPGDAKADYVTLLQQTIRW